MIRIFVAFMAWTIKLCFDFLNTLTRLFKFVACLRKLSTFLIFFVVNICLTILSIPISSRNSFLSSFLFGLKMKELRLSNTLVTPSSLTNSAKGKTPSIAVFTISDVTSLSKFLLSS